MARSLAASVLAALTTAAASPVETPSEYEVKAAFLVNFARFVEWPESSFARNQGVLTIGILGTDPFGPAARDLLEGKILGSRTLTVLRFADLEEVQPVQILFVNGLDAAHVPQLLEKLHGSAVLTVGDKEGFARAGFVINFVLEQNRVRFEVNPEAAKRVGLKISSKLLSVAKVVVPDAGRR